MKSSIVIRLFTLLMVFSLSACGGDEESNSDSTIPEECPTTSPYEVDGTCVACLEDGHCSGTLVCDIATYTCGCPEGTPYSEGDGCFECLKDKNCPGQQACDLGLKICAEVTCPAETPYLVNGDCVTCANNSHCSGDLICKASTHLCECSDPTLLVLEDQCVECIKSTDCPVGQYCKDNLCVGEDNVSNCPVDKPHNFNGECWECLLDEDCTSEGEYCHESLLYCVPPEMVCEGETPYKYLGECVECLENAHCAETEICTKSDHVCDLKPVSPGECVFDGTGSHVGDLIGNFGALDCSGEMLNLHDFCGNTKAVWLISVAGWCGACDSWAPEANGLYEELKGQGLQLIFVLGEDPQGNPPTPSYCQQWKQSHGVSAPILLDGHWAGLDSRITPSGYDLPWDYLLDGDNMMYVWESVEFSSEDLMNNIQTLLAD